MRFWDSSAIVPLLAGETYTGPMTREYEADPAMLVWWAASVECASALARREREGRLRGAPMSEALERLASLQSAWREVEPVDRVRRAAMRLLRVHPLRAADALHLGAALVAAEDNPRTLPFVTLDEELSLAAEREGFVVVGPGLT
jgi:predicted nucleic acid-binding protein